MKEYLLPVAEAKRRMNAWGKANIPFLFAVDFELENALTVPLDQIDPNRLQFDLNGFSNAPSPSDIWLGEIHLERLPPTFSHYQRAFQKVQYALGRGDSFLVNLTFPSPVITPLTLQEIFQKSRAKYRLWWQDKLVLFSPETFITIRDGRITTFPMKGTIDARIPNAGDLLLADPKEKAEHATIVDLLRNDLSQIATKVRVEKYRYIEKLDTDRGELLQTSSQIAGDLPSNYHQKIGDLLFRLLPAGSISGAPKRKTVSIIREAETGKRGFYTGVCGIFANGQMESAVMIRFIESTPTGLVFRSGGGITAFSDVKSEYQELINKVYLPIPKPLPALSK